MALLKSIRCAAALAGPSSALLAAALTSCRDSGVNRAETPKSKLMLVQSDNVHALWEDIGTSRAQRAYHRQSRLEVERHRQRILQADFGVETVDKPVISLAMASPSAD